MPSLVAQVVPSEARITTGAITLDLLRGQEGIGFEAGHFFLDVSAASGTTPTLDVTVTAIGPGGRERLIATFAQAVGVTSEAVAVAAALLPFASALRIDFTIGGTTPSFTFSVDAHVTA